MIVIPRFPKYTIAKTQRESTKHIRKEITPDIRAKPHYME